MIGISLHVQWPLSSQSHGSLKNHLNFWSYWDEIFLKTSQPSPTHMVGLDVESGQGIWWHIKKDYI
jgi:hypothetical protein